MRPHQQIRRGIDGQRGATDADLRRVGHRNRAAICRVCRVRQHDAARAPLHRLTENDDNIGPERNSHCAVHRIKAADHRGGGPGPGHPAENRRRRLAPGQPGGMDFGPGPGSEAIQIPNMAVSPSHTIRTLAQNDPTGDAELLYKALLSRGL